MRAKDFFILNRSSRSLAPYRFLLKAPVESSEAGPLRGIQRGKHFSVNSAPPILTSDRLLIDKPGTDTDKRLHYKKSVMSFTLMGADHTEDVDWSSNGMGT